MAYRWNKGHEDERAEEELSTILALLIMTPLLVLLFALSSKDPSLNPASGAEWSLMATTIVLPPR